MPDNPAAGSEKLGSKRIGSKRIGSKRAGSHPTPTVITNAHSGTSREMASREKRYAITMGIRTACFVCMIFVPGPFRWVLLAGAVFLPYVAVILANQANTRHTEPDAVPQVAPEPAVQLTVGPPPAEVIDGELVDDELVDHAADHRHDRVA